MVLRIKNIGLQGENNEDILRTIHTEITRKSNVENVTIHLEMITVLRKFLLHIEPHASIIHLKDKLRNNLKQSIMYCWIHRVTKRC